MWESQKAQTQKRTINVRIAWPRSRAMNFQTHILRFSLFCSHFGVRTKICFVNIISSTSENQRRNGKIVLCEIFVTHSFLTNIPVIPAIPSQFSSKFFLLFCTFSNSNVIFTKTWTGKLWQLRSRFLKKHPLLTVDYLSKA